MPRFKTPDYGLKMIPVDFAQQVLPGTFEFALWHLVDNELDLSTLRSRYTNDAGGAPAFDPAVLLKIVLLAYSRGLISSRSIAGACRNNVLFMAVSGDSAPHFTTIAGFVAELGDEAAALFTQVLLVCDRQGLIGRELFAIDGVKLPSNAAKAKSGTRADFEREAAKMEAAVQRMMGDPLSQTSCRLVRIINPGAIVEETKWRDTDKLSRTKLLGGCCRRRVHH
ncbi:transposase, partial [Methyloversatilis sp.]